MDTLKLLIADGNEEFREALAEALQGTYYVRTCRTGKEAMALLRSFGPDVLVVNLILPEVDGITLMEDAAASGIRPMVLATTPLENPYILECITRLGVDYMMLHPCEVSATVARIRDLSRRLNAPVISLPDPKTQVSNLLLSLGIPTRLKGYNLAREAILLMAKDPDLAITKELYPAVAAICGGDTNHVERSIRSAVAAAWANRDDRIWKQYFKPGPDGVIRRPTNGTFITRLADSLRLSQANLEQNLGA